MAMPPAFEDIAAFLLRNHLHTPAADTMGLSSRFFPLLDSTHFITTNMRDKWKKKRMRKLRRKRRKMRARSK
ncbi:hypothetical protein CcaverHIS641_0209200 [Cutaneotrichosporon cavernicola]|nr:hypothetical protein CcaverHIS641_0209200 [Cutaneotrichosporon cavernicola]